MQKKFNFKGRSIQNYAKYNKMSPNHAQLFLKEFTEYFGRSWGLGRISLGKTETTRVYSNFYMHTHQFVFVLLEKINILWDLSYTSFGKFVLYNREISTGILFKYKDDGFIEFERIFNIGEDPNKTTTFNNTIRKVSHFDFRKNSLCK